MSTRARARRRITAAGGAQRSAIGRIATKRDARGRLKSRAAIAGYQLITLIFSPVACRRCAAIPRYRDRAFLRCGVLARAEVAPFLVVARFPPLFPLPPLPFRSPYLSIRFCEPCRSIDDPREENSASEGVREREIRLKQNLEFAEQIPATFVSSLATSKFDTCVVTAVFSFHNYPQLRKKTSTI